MRTEKSIRRSGFTLIELLAILMGVTLAMALGTVVLIGALRIQKASSSSLENQTSRADVADRFRADIASASGLGEAAGDQIADAHHLVINLNSSTRIVYRVVDRRLQRLVFGSDGKLKQLIPLGPPVAQIEVSRDGLGGRLIGLQLDLPAQAQAPDGNRQWRLVAALGGDRR